MACRTACRADRSSAFFLGPSARQWLARRLAGWIALRLPSSFLPLVSGLPDGLLGGALFGFLPRSFRSSVACLTACLVDRCSTSFFVPSARQSLARRLPGWITHRLTSLFLPLVSGFPDSSSDGLLIGLLPCSFRSSVAFPIAPLTDCSSAYFLVLPLINDLPDGSLVSLLPRCFCSSMACLTAGWMGRSSAYFLVPSACWPLARGWPVRSLAASSHGCAWHKLWSPVTICGVLLVIGSVFFLAGFCGCVLRFGVFKFSSFWVSGCTVV